MVNYNSKLRAVKSIPAERNKPGNIMAGHFTAVDKDRSDLNRE